MRGCGDLALNLAHELGHALGLAAQDHPAYATTIMADLEPGNLFQRAITAEECRLAGRRWSTLIELASRDAPTIHDAPLGAGTERAEPERAIPTPELPR